MKTVSECKALLSRKELTSVELTKSYLERIRNHDHKLNSFLALNDTAEEQAKRSDQKIKEGNGGPLEGVPIALKDMIVTKGLETTAASKILEGYIPPYSATLVDRLEAAGAVIVGKNNQDEFAMGASNETSAYGSSKNPWSQEHVPGGSSGGSAAAVAGGLVPASIGTDTGGSIRQPAAFCGVVGFKPTYGRISRYGVIAYASSLDQAGPLSLTVEDAAVLTEIMAGRDEHDATSSSRPSESWSQNISLDMKAKKVGILKNSFSGEVDPEIQSRVRHAKRLLVEAGAEVVEVELPSFEIVVPTYYLIAMSEASSNLARYDGIRYGLRTTKSESAMNLDALYCESRSLGFGEEVKRRLLLGTFALSSGYREEYYLKACQARRQIYNEFSEIFKRCEVLLSPVATSAAFKTGERIHNPLQMYLGDVFTASANLAGLPAMSLPVGKNSEGLPLGIQLLANSFGEQSIFDVGSFLEKEMGGVLEVPHGLQ